MERLYFNLKTAALAVFMLTTFFLSACKDAYENDTFMAYEELPISLLLQNDSDNKYSLWVEVLHKAELFNTLNLNNNYTLFAPVNDGVERYLEKLNISSVSQMSKEDADYLVKYHLIPYTKVDLAQFQSGAIDNLTATDDNLFIEFRDDGLFSIFLNGESRFNAFDIKATNGIVHSIDDVLIPLTATVLDRLEDDKYSIFHQAVLATGLDEILDRIYTDAVDPNGNPIQQRFRYTTFTVSNSTYAAEGINSFESLVTKLGATVGADYTVQTSPVYKYVAYHILPQLRSYADLGKFPQGKTTMNIQTLATNELIKVSAGTAELIINANAATQHHIGFVESNIIAKNGVVHEVDNWMPVFLPERVQVIWEFTDYPDVAANVTQYRNPSLGAQYNKTFAASELTSINWLSLPEGRSDALIYRNLRAADALYTAALNHDYLLATLGESGWIEMKSPAIVRGKYRVTYVWPSPRNTTNTGIISLIMDNREIFPRLVISNTSSDARRTQVLGTVDFPETTSHTLRLLSLDGKLITMDYLQFDPID